MRALAGTRQRSLATFRYIGSFGPFFHTFSMLFYFLLNKVNYLFTLQLVGEAVVLHETGVVGMCTKVFGMYSDPWKYTTFFSVFTIRGGSVVHMM